MLQQAAEGYRSFLVKLHTLDITTVWTGSDADDLYLRPLTPENILLMRPDRKLVVTPNLNDWLSSKKSPTPCPIRNCVQTTDRVEHPVCHPNRLEYRSLSQRYDDPPAEQGNSIAFVPVDLIASLYGNGCLRFRSNFKHGTRRPCRHIFDSISTKYRLLGDLTLTTSKEILALVHKRRRPVHEEPASISHTG